MLHTRMNSTVGQLYFNIHSEKEIRFVVTGGKGKGNCMMAVEKYKLPL